MSSISIIILFFSFITDDITLAKNKDPFTVKRILSNELLLTKNGTIIQIPHISPPDKYLRKDRFDSCYYLKTKKFLQQNLLNKTITTSSHNNSTKEILYPAIIKLPTGEDLSEVLITLGLAQNTSKKEAFITAEQKAKTELQGLWQRCGAENKGRFFAKKKYRTNIPKAIRHNFQNQSNGKIRSVISNNTIELENGLQIHIWGLRGFDHKSITPAHKCFEEATIQHLESWLKNKTIFMEKPRIARDSNKKIERLVYLDEPLSGSLEFITETLIKNGYGLPDTNVRNSRQKKLQWAQWAETAITHKQGAWSKCHQAIKTTFARKITSATQTKKFDPSCSIKGNITGTKSNPVKKYHTVASPWYQRTQAEKCFVDEAAALADGFVKVK